MDIHKLDWFYVTSFPDKGRITLDHEEARHLKVKRHHEDEKICIFDGKGKLAIATIAGKQVIIEKTEFVENTASLTIAVSVPKGDRMDWMLQKLTELNVATIIPMKTKYSVVLPKEKKHNRWNRILIEACKQCKRAWIPEVKTLTNFDEIIKMKSDVKLILLQDGKSISKTNKDVLALIGPEGGFTEDEIASAEKNGFVKTNIAPLTLRIETAAIALASILNQ